MVYIKHAVEYYCKNKGLDESNVCAVVAYTSA